MKISQSISLVILPAILLCSSPAFSQDLQPMLLPPPQLEGGKPLMQVLRDRATSRSFSSERLPVQTLSNLLWAAFGMNRPDSGKRTAPSALNWQEIDIYVALPEGLYLYEAKKHALVPVLKEDIRVLTGQQPFVKDAPVNLIYVADLSKTGTATKEDQNLYTAVDTGFISQNVYLYCASEGLATVVRGLMDREKLAKAMMLRQDQKIIVAQTVGYPKIMKK